jgi:hypothetical protein
MTNQKLTIISVSLISLFLVVIFAALKHQAQDKSQIQNLDNEPTQIEEGQFTDRQRKHSKLYQRPAEARKIPLGRGDIKVIVHSGYKEQLIEGEPIPQWESYIQKIACQADAVLVGNVRSRTPQMTEDKKSVFSDYEIEIQDVLKDNPVSSLNSDTTIILTASGGIVRLKGQVIDVIDKSYKRLEMGEKYIFFLKYLDDSNSYQLIDTGSEFKISDEAVTQVNDTASFRGKNNNLIDFLTNTRQSTQKCHERKK